MRWLSYAVLDVLNETLNISAASEWIYDLSYKSRCVKLNFAYSCGLTRDVNHLLYHSACVEPNFGQTSSFRVDLFLLPYHLRGIKNDFLCVWSLRMDVLSLICLSRCVKFYFSNNSSLRLDVFLLPCQSIVLISILCLLSVYDWVYYLLNAIYAVLKWLLRKCNNEYITSPMPLYLC